MQRDRITRAEIEAFGTTAECPSCDAIRSGKRTHSDPCRRIEECLKMTPEGAERLDRRSEVLNEALAREDKKDVRRREEIESTAGELAAPQGPKDVPIPPDSDPRKRHAMKAASAVASSGSSQMESSRSVAEESRMDVEASEAGPHDHDKEVRCSVWRNIEDLGEKTTPFKSVEGVHRCIKFRSTNVVKPLISMRKVVQVAFVTLSHS